MLLSPNAKINIGLSITERREDGYHNLETVFWPINLCDSLQITQSEEPGIHLYTSGLSMDCEAKDNLIYRAAEDMLTLIHDPHAGINIHFQKQIPFGAGLGGGSSDASHTAKAINEIFQLGLTPADLAQRLKKLGADCPFFIYNTPCLATGIGDILTPISLSLKGYTLLLVKPNESVSTKTAYAGVTPKQPIVPLQELLAQPVETWPDKVVNDFEPSVFAKHPNIATTKERLYQMGASYASMSGSGSTVYGIFPNETAPTKAEIEKTFPNLFHYQETLL